VQSFLGSPPGAARATELPRVLFVDDEVAVLDGLRRQLRRRFDVLTATGGDEALQLLAATDEPVPVIVSDMRMPGMDGATLLGQVRRRHPEVVRILLTGQADTQSAIAAVNEGSIHRFLTKPCPPDVLVDELTSAVELHRLATLEKHLLATTLRATVEALLATLSLAQPMAFARAGRISSTAVELAEVLQVDDAWSVEITAQLAALGAVALPTTVLTKLDRGRPLDEDEQAMVDRVPGLSRDLVAGIPRLEDTAAAIGWQQARFDGAGARPGVPAGSELPLSARILKVAVDFEGWMSVQSSVQRALEGMRADGGAYDPEVLGALAVAHELVAAPGDPRPVEVGQLRPGTTVAQDLQTVDGLLLVGRGTEVTDTLIERLSNFEQQGRFTGPVLVVDRAGER
jgi:response regulator RpfG family c-di-GMP phosphodiesterase